MAVHSSSSPNETVPHPNISFSSSNFPLDIGCFYTGPSSFIVSAYFLTNIVLFLPLCIFILHHGLQQWKQKHSTSLAATMTHTDAITYHMVTLLLIHIFGFFISFIGIYSKTYLVFLVGFYFFSFSGFGDVFFHVLTCVERYLAVVHPVTYLNLKNEKGIRMRNMITGCVWLWCFVGISVLMEKFYIIINFSYLILALTIVSFCSLSVLCVLIRPGPGDQDRGIKRVGQSKLRAFYTIVSILGVLVVRFVWSLAWAILFVTKKNSNCILMTSDLWFTVPCSLVVPLLYLQRAGKLMCFKKRNQ